MPYTKLKAVNFGASKTGLGNVSYQLKNADGTNNGSSITTGISEVGQGNYQATVAIPDDFNGGILWNSGEGTPLLVYDIITPNDDEYLDREVSSLAGGSGIYTVTITVQETGGTPKIAGADVSVRDSADGSLLDRRTTDSNGVATFMLGDGTFKVYKVKLGYSFTNPETLTVGENTTMTVIGTPL